MAKIKYGSIITDTRGTIGGHTLTWTRYGPQIITKPQTAKLKTQKQSQVRENFLGLSKRWWAVLSPSQRDDWRALAAANPRPNTWGDLFPLTGLALYIAINQLLHQAGEPTTDDAPTDQAVTPVATATITATAPNTFSLAFTPSPVPADHVLYVATTGPISPGITNTSKAKKFLAVSAFAATTPLDLSSELLSLFGDVITGRQYAVAAKFLNTTNGALSAGLETSAIAT